MTLEPLDPVAACELAHPALTDPARSELGLEIAEHDVGNTHVDADELEQGLVRPAALVELQHRDTQALLVDLGGIGRARPRHPAPDVVVVADQHRVAEQIVIDEDRHEHEDVREMHAARLVRVVEDDDVPGRDVVAVLPDHRLHCIRDRAEMQRKAEPLGDHPPVAVAEGARQIHGVLHDRRIRDAHHREHHLVHHRANRILHELEPNRVVGHVAFSDRRPVSGPVEVQVVIRRGGPTGRAIPGTRRSPAPRRRR